jgi:CheY-like chemotaxis protein
MDQICRKPRLLAIDDHHDSAELIARVAEKLGYEAKATSSPEVLRDVLAEWRPDILTVDLCMPEEDGLGVFVLLEQIGFAGGIVIVSGQDEWLRKSASRLASARGLNVVGNLSKPVYIKGLRAVLTEVQVGI